MTLRSTGPGTPFTTADQFAFVGGEVRGVDAVEQTGFGALFGAAFGFALGLGGGFVGRSGLSVIGGAGLKPVFLQLNQRIDQPLVGGHPFYRCQRGAWNPADVELAVVFLGLVGLIGQ